MFSARRLAATVAGAALLAAALAASAAAQPAYGLTDNLSDRMFGRDDRGRDVDRGAVLDDRRGFPRREFRPGEDVNRGERLGLEEADRQLARQDRLERRWREDDRFRDDRSRYNRRGDGDDGSRRRYRP